MLQVRDDVLNQGLKTASELRLIFLNMKLDTLLAVPGRGGERGPVVKNCNYEDTIMMTGGNVLCPRDHCDISPGEIRFKRL